MMGMPNQTSRPVLHLLDTAIGALKLHALHLEHPTAVSKDTALDAGREALDHLRLIDREALQLAEAYRCVCAIVKPPLSVTVAPTTTGMLTATIMDGPHALQTIQAKTPEGLAELVRTRQRVSA